MNTFQSYPRSTTPDVTYVKNIVKAAGIAIPLVLAAGQVSAGLSLGTSTVECVLDTTVGQISTSSIPWPHFGVRYNLTVWHRHVGIDPDGELRNAHTLNHSSQLQLPNRVPRPLTIKVRHNHVGLGESYRSQASHFFLKCSDDFWRELPDQETLQDGCGQDRSPN